VRQWPVLEFGDDLLDDRVVAMSLVGFDQVQGGVGDKRVVAEGREQLALLGAVTGQWLQSFDSSHDQAAGEVLGLAAPGERDEVDFGDLGVADPALFGFVEDRLGWTIVVQASSRCW